MYKDDTLNMPQNVLSKVRLVIILSFLPLLYAIKAIVYLICSEAYNNVFPNIFHDFQTYSFSPVFLKLLVAR